MRNERSKTTIRVARLSDDDEIVALVYTSRQRVSDDDNIIWLCRQFGNLTKIDLRARSGCDRK
jgi:hypothetical protein